jgi:hypothetical protein
MRGSFEGTLRLTQLSSRPTSFILEATAQGSTGTLNGNGVSIRPRRKRPYHLALRRETPQVERRQVLAAGFRLLETATRAIIRQCLTSLEQEIACPHHKQRLRQRQAKFLLGVAQDFARGSSPTPTAVGYCHPAGGRHSRIRPALPLAAPQPPGKLSDPLRSNP